MGGIEVVWKRSVLVAQGAAIETSVEAHRGMQVVPEAFKQNREKRDGTRACHITLLNKDEARQCKDRGLAQSDLLQAAREACAAAPFVVVGMGSSSRAGDKTFYLVVIWPAVQAWRQTMGFSRKGLHVTIGFSSGDIHECDKGVGTLIASGHPYTPKDLSEMYLASLNIKAVEEKQDVLDAVLFHTLHTAPDATRERSRALQAKAQLYFELGDSSKAISFLEAAVKLTRHPKSFLLLGDVLLKSGKQKDAVVAYRNGLRACRETGKLKRIEDLLLQRLKRHPVEVPKFPRTKHLFDFGSATRDDLLLPPNERHAFCDPNHIVTVEEKLDGANLGIWVDEDWQLVTKNRSHLVCGESAPQFSGLPLWLETHRAVLYEVLGQRYALFGEWMYAKHSIQYSSLPGVLVAFDVFDRVTDNFLSVASRDQIIKKTGIPIIATVHRGCFQLDTIQEDLCNLVETKRSSYYDGKMEGIVLRSDERPREGKSDAPTFLKTRSKIVRAAFSQEIGEHWTRTTMVRNGLRIGNGASAGETKYPSTVHLPFSPTVHQDDVCAQAEGISNFLCHKRMIITEKIDGGNCCLKDGQVFGRTHSRPATHWSFGPVKEMYATLLSMHQELLEDYELFGENVSAVHSIAYDALYAPFYLFAARKRGADEWLSWDHVQELASQLNIATVPLVFDGVFSNLKQLEAVIKAETLKTSRLSTEVGAEGFVVRSACAFPQDKFEQNVFKYVRANHIQTSSNWKSTCGKATIPLTLEEGLARVPPPVSAQHFRLYVDLDGTLADFEKKLFEITGKMRHELAASAMWRAVEKDRNFFGSLEWMSGSKEMWQTHLVPLQPTILSAVPRSEGRKFERQKMSWCASHLGEDVPVILCTGQQKAIYSGPGRILIDDRERARRPWEKAGGIFILHTSAERSVQELQKVLAAQSQRPDSCVQGAKVSATLKGRPCAKLPPRAPRAAKGNPGCSAHRLVVLMGLPGSGKSTLALQLQAQKANITLVSQDQLGSRGACEDLVGRAIKSGPVIVDRCNVTRVERKRWVDLAMVSPKHATLVWVQTDRETCIGRVLARANHPTIQTKNPKSVRQVVTSFEKSLEEPNSKKEGFGRVFRVTSREEIEAIVPQLC